MIINNYKTSFGFGTMPTCGFGYCFTKTQVSSGNRADYFVKIEGDKELASHKAVKLPANGDSRWQAVGSGITVELRTSDNTSLGIWDTCNYDCSLPEQVGTLYDFIDANSITGITLPTKAQFDNIHDNCTWGWAKVHGKVGIVAQAHSGFLFLPATSSTCKYWSSINSSDSNAYYLCCANAGGNTVDTASKSNKFGIRPIHN